MKKEGSGLIGFVSGARPKEPKAPRQAKAKHKTIPFFAAGHGKPAKKWSCCFAAEVLRALLLSLLVGYRRLAAHLPQRNSLQEKINSLSVCSLCLHFFYSSN